MLEFNIKVFASIEKHFRIPKGAQHREIDIHHIQT